MIRLSLGNLFSQIEQLGVAAFGYKIFGSSAFAQ